MLNVLFNLDGTLTDPREGIVACLQFALLGLGHNCLSDLDLARFIGPAITGKLRSVPALHRYQAD
jgi:phosphoglycolate phosphatase